MNQTSHWPKAVFWSVFFHVIWLAGIGFAHWLQPEQAQEEFVAISLVDIETFKPAGMGASGGSELNSTVSDNSSISNYNQPESPNTEPTVRREIMMSPVSSATTGEAVTPVLTNSQGQSGGNGGEGKSTDDVTAVGHGNGGQEVTGGIISAPVILSAVEPEYPESARRDEVEGRVVLKVMVKENGRVGEIIILSSSGHNNLDTAAQKAVREWRFIPAQNGLGQSIERYCKVPVDFKLN